MSHNFFNLKISNKKLKYFNKNMNLIIFCCFLTEKMFKMCYFKYYISFTLYHTDIDVNFKRLVALTLT